DGIRDWSVTGVQTCALRIWGLDISWWPATAWSTAKFRDGFLDAAQRRLADALAGKEGHSEHAEVTWDGRDRVYRLARLAPGPGEERRAAGRARGCVVGRGT